MHGEERSHPAQAGGRAVAGTVQPAHWLGWRAGAAVLGGLGWFAVALPQPGRFWRLQGLDTSGLPGIPGRDMLEGVS